MSISAQRKSPYKQSIFDMPLEEYSPTKRLHMERGGFNGSKEGFIGELTKKNSNDYSNYHDNDNDSSNVKFSYNINSRNNNNIPVGNVNNVIRNIKHIPLVGHKENEYISSPVTKEMFLEYYAMSKQNLSTIECPNSLEGTSFLKAPEAYYEIRRLNTVEKYMNLPHWEHTNRFKTLLMKMMEMFNCNGAAISLIDSRYQVVKFEFGLGFDKCSRQISMDSHTILSNSYFLILDASKDWRFKGNPIIKGIPNIKFYLGVPLIASNKQIIGVLSIFDSFPRTHIEDSTFLIMKKMCSEIIEYLESPLKRKIGENNNNNNNNKGLKSTSKLLASTCLPDANIYNNKKGNEINNSQKLLEMYGRATGNNKFNEEIIFEKDGSGNSYKYNSNYKFTKFCCPYDDLIDLEIWSKISKCDNLRSASNLLCEILVDKLKYDCVYIMNVKESKNCWIACQYYPISEKEIEIENYKFKDKIKWTNDPNDYEDSDEVYENKLGIMQMNIVGISCNDQNIANSIINDGDNYFHNRAITSSNGINYQSNDKKNIFHSGCSLPFYRSGNKLVRKKRVRPGKDKNELMGLFFKSNGYLITCLDTKERELSENEIGYVYGCASIFRRIFFY